MRQKDNKKSESWLQIIRILPLHNFRDVVVLAL